MGEGTAEPPAQQVAPGSAVPGDSTAALGRTVPADSSIAIRPGSGQPKRGPVPGERRHPMRGYEERWTDIVDDVVGITERIWEDQDVGYVHDTYSPGVRLHDDGGWRFGVEGVVEATVASIDAVPDARLRCTGARPVTTTSASARRCRRP